MKFSLFGEKYSSRSGIVELMDDLGNALRLNPDMISLGGGTPARIPQVEAAVRDCLQQLCASPENVHRLVGVYQAPQGDEALLRQVADFLRVEYGWPLTWRNVAVSNGGQSAFFLLSNMLAGRGADGGYRHLQLPLAPEYLGYTDAGLEEGFFVSSRPAIEILDEHLFKYRVDFEALRLDESTGAVCVSRPTNPTGNVLTDAEIARLDRLCRARHIPFIIDGAYGAPFPGIVFTEISPHWNDNTVLLLSLSKLGLPGARGGFVIAGEELISAFASANTILNLACGNLGPAIAAELFKGGRILRMSRELIMPFYRERARMAVDWFMQALGDLPYYIHKPEGAFFLWLWFKDLPISSAQLYERLKARGVLVISGHSCFPGLPADWPHMHECIRVSYAQEAEAVREGIRLIAEEVRKAYGAGNPP